VLLTMQEASASDKSGRGGSPDDLAA